MRWLLAFLTVLSATSARAEPRRQGVIWAGLSLRTGHLSMRAPQAALDTRLTALPGLNVGTMLMGASELGVYAEGTLGAGASVALPSGQAFRFNQHQLGAGAVWRCELGAGPDGPRLLTGVGLRVLIQNVRHQIPSAHNDRRVAGPEASLTGILPLGRSGTALTAGAQLGLPFFVREHPDDSGAVRRSLSWGLSGGGRVPLGPTWSLQAEARYEHLALSFEGEATRAGGLRGVSTEDRYLSMILALRRPIGGRPHGHTSAESSQSRSPGRGSPSPRHATQASSRR